MKEILRAENIRKTYYSGRIEVEALKSTEILIPNESINVIIGRSGSGKSTLLKVLGGLLKPDSGQVIIDTKSIYTLNESNLARFRSLKVGFVFQEFNLINEMTVINNIRLPFDINGLTYDLQTEEEILSLLDLKERMNFYPDQLSGGERQRVAIARASLMKPSLIFADEPTGNLDSDSGKNVIKFFEMSNRLDKQTYVIVTHDTEWLQIAHNVFRMIDGRIIPER